ncbi:MAG: hypothetical protein ACK559_32715, partial [bacterium]
CVTEDERRGWSVSTITSTPIRHGSNSVIDSFSTLQPPGQTWLSSGKTDVFALRTASTRMPELIAGSKRICS